MAGSIIGTPHLHTMISDIPRTQKYNGGYDYIHTYNGPRGAHTMEYSSAPNSILTNSIHNSITSAARYTFAQELAIYPEMSSLLAQRYLEISNFQVLLDLLLFFCSSRIRLHPGLEVRLSIPRSRGSSRRLKPLLLVSGTPRLAQLSATSVRS